MGAESLLDVLALSNVGGNATDCIGFSALVAERELDRDIGMRPIRMWRHFFVFYRAILLEYDHVICPKGISRLTGKDLMIGMAHNLLGRQIENLFKSAIDEEIPAVRVFHIDHCGSIVCH